MLTFFAAIRRQGMIVGAFITAGIAISGVSAQESSGWPQPQSHWVVTWGASPAPGLPAEAEMAASHLLFHGQTVREMVHVSLGGRQVRVRFSNIYGPAPLRIDAASLAVRNGDPHLLKFGGGRSFTIPTNAVAISDPVDLPVPSASDLAISLYLPDAARGAGIHYASCQTSFVAAGDLTGVAKWPEGGTKLSSWVFLSGVDVLAPASAGAVATFGDSITDGAHSSPNLNHRWPDILAQRLLARSGTPELGVLNAGIGGNRLRYDAAKRVAFGVNGLSRFDRDVLAQPGVRYLIVLEGINDLGHPGAEAPAAEAPTAGDLIGALSQLAERAQERGIKVFGATLTPFEAAAFPGYFTPEKELIRQKYNAWIRKTRKLDGVVDFDLATRDPSHPTHLLPAYDSGDHWHPNDAGYKAMGEAVDLRIFR